MLQSICKDCADNHRKTLKFPRRTSGEKCCTCCHINKPVKDYASCPAVHDGLGSHCKTCRAQQENRRKSTYNGYIKHIYLEIKKRVNKKNKKVEEKNKKLVKNGKIPDPNENPLEFVITEQYLHDLYTKQEGKCAILKVTMTHRHEPVPLEKKSSRSQKNPRHTYNISPDKINSTLGYMPGNIHLVCNVINNMKWDIPIDVFYSMCKLVAEKHATASMTVATQTPTDELPRLPK
jgi:hypothetical protein